MPRHVNANGGAIATRAPAWRQRCSARVDRRAGTARPRARRALATMCIGVGQGISIPARIRMIPTTYDLEQTMTTTEAVTVDQAAGPAGSDAGPSPATPTPISDRARDYLNLDSLFTAEELAQRDKVRTFVDAAESVRNRALVRGRCLPRVRSPPNSVISGCSGCT